MPYKHIAAQLKKTELACRLHYHQLSFGSKARRQASVSSYGSMERASAPHPRRKDTSLHNPNDVYHLPLLQLVHLRTWSAAQPTHQRHPTATSQSSQNQYPAATDEPSHYVSSPKTWIVIPSNNMLIWQGWIASTRLTDYISGLLLRAAMAATCRLRR